MKLTHCTLKFENRSVFDDFSFEVAPKKWTCLLGSSGIGKSSLLKIFAGLLKPQSMQLDNIQPISYLPQQDCLLPWLNVEENIFLGFRLRGEKISDTLRKKATDLLNRTGIPNTQHLKPNALSGGMRQRVALIRTLLEDNPIVLIDEPFSALDFKTRWNLHELSRELLEDKTVLWVTHDPLEASRIADVIYILEGNPARIGHEFSMASAPKEKSPLPHALNSQEYLALYQKLVNALS